MFSESQSGIDHFCYLILHAMMDGNTTVETTKVLFKLYQYIFIWKKYCNSHTEHIMAYRSILPWWYSNNIIIMRYYFQKYPLPWLISNNHQVSWLKSWYLHGPHSTIVDHRVYYYTNKMETTYHVFSLVILWNTQPTKAYSFGVSLKDICSLIKNKIQQYNVQITIMLPLHHIKVAVAARVGCKHM